MVISRLSRSTPVDVSPHGGHVLRRSAIHCVLWWSAWWTREASLNA